MPYFAWNLFYGILSEAVRGIGLVDYGDSLGLQSLFVRPWIDGHQYAFNIPAWFLLALFLVSVITCLLRAVLKKLRILNDYLLLAVLFAVSGICIYYSQQGYNTGWWIPIVRTGFLLPFFQFGFVYKRFEGFFDKNRLSVIAILTVALYLVLAFNPKPLGINCAFAKFDGNPAFFLTVQIIVLLLLPTVFGAFTPAFENMKLLNYLGNHTFTVMMHHPVWLFFINTVLYTLNNWFDISSFDVQKYKSTIWYCCPWRDARIYFFYVLFAMAMPLVFKWVWDKMIVTVYHKKINKNQSLEGDN